MSDNATFEDDRALRYDNFIQTWMPNYGFLQRTIARLLVDEVKDGAVLVAGCGTGNEMQKLIEHGLTLPITGIDPSPQMVEVAREKLKEHSQVELLDGQVRDLPKGMKFSAATLILVMHFLPDDGTKLALLKDIARSLKPGAPFFLAQVFGSQREIKANLKVLQASLPTSIPMEDQENHLTRLEETLHYIPEARLVELLQEAGFETPIRFFQSSIYGGWWTRKK